MRGKRAWFEYVVGVGVLHVHPPCESRLGGAGLGEAAVQWCEPASEVASVASKALAIDDFMPTAAGDPAVDAERGKALLPADDKITRLEDSKHKKRTPAGLSCA